MAEHIAQPYQSASGSPAGPTAEKPRTGLGGHPRGLATLFFTEMWERFSYYGMRALLVLFMTASTAGMNHGMGLDLKKAAAIYGLYTSGVYLLSLPGGWVADRLWGQRKAVFVGGCGIACGHFSMAIPTTSAFYLGLVLIALGTGLLKPNVSAMVADLYPEGGARRDAGFSIFYMGINIGGFGGPILCGLVGEGYNFHWGFALAGFGMILGLVQYSLGGKHLGRAGRLQSEEPKETLARRSRNFYLAFAAVVAAVVAFAFAVSAGVLNVGIGQVAVWLGYAILILSGAFFLFLFFAAGLTNVEKKRMGVIVWLFLLAAIFFSGFEQMGSSLNIFARDLTNRTIGGWQVPASWLQDVNPGFIIIFAPVFGWLWVWLASRNAHPSIQTKFAFGLTGMAAGLLVLSWGAANATDTHRASMAWLVVTYFFYTVGELCLSPVGLSSMTKLAPVGRVGQMMGVWFVGTALGDLFAGLVAGHMQELTPSTLFRSVALIIGTAALIAFAASPVFKRLTCGVE